MEDNNNIEPEVPVVPRRSRRLALSELNESISSPGTPDKTPTPSPDEMIIIQRGPRCKPITWSPVDYEFNKADLLGPPKDITPEKKPGKAKPELNPKLRRRLIMSPGKTSADLGLFIAKKLRGLQRINNDK